MRCKVSIILWRHGRVSLGRCTGSSGRSRCRRTRRTRLAGARALRLGFRFGFSLGPGLLFRRRRLCGGAAVLGGTALRGVVVHVPPRALELEARRGEGALQCATTLGADLLRLGAEFLDSFKTMAALCAAIRVQGQVFYLSSRNLPLPSILARRRQFFSNCRLLFGCQRPRKGAVLSAP